MSAPLLPAGCCPPSFGLGTQQWTNRPYHDIANPWANKHPLAWRVWSEELWLLIITALFILFGLIFALLVILFAYRAYKNAMDEAFREYWNLEVKNAKQVYKVKRQLDKERRKMREKLARARAGRMRKTVSMFLPVPGILPTGPEPPPPKSQYGATKDTGDAVKGHDMAVGTEPSQFGAVAGKQSQMDAEPPGSKPTSVTHPSPSSGGPFSVASGHAPTPVHNAGDDKSAKSDSVMLAGKKHDSTYV